MTQHTHTTPPTEIHEYTTKLPHGSINSHPVVGLFMFFRARAIANKITNGSNIR